MTQQTLTPRTPNLVWGIIDISDMPKRFRLDVEQLFVEYLPSPAPSEDTRDYAAIDALSAEWFTQWRRSRSNPVKPCRSTLPSWKSWSMRWPSSPTSKASPRQYAVSKARL